MTDLWYYTSAGQRMEPVTTAELKQLAASGLLKRTDLVWREGMPDWVRAGTMAEIFSAVNVSAANEGRRLGASSVRESETIPLASADDEPAEPRPRRRVSRDYVDDDDYGERRPRRRRRNEGLGTGVKVVLGVGGGLLALVLVILVVWWIASSGGGGGGNAGPLNQSYSISLAGQRLDARFFELRAGARIEFTVRSDRNSDVDILVYDANNNVVTGDESIGPNSFCMLVPPRSERYKVEIRNLGPGSNRSHVTIREVAAAAPPGIPVVGKK